MTLALHLGLATLVASTLFLELKAGTQTAKFSRCSRGRTPASPELSVTVAGYSGTHCAALCSKTTRCQAASVCPGNGPGSVTCYLHTGQQAQDCTALDAAVSPWCFYMRKKTSSDSATDGVVEISTHTASVTAETPYCFNGGTLQNGACHCQIQWSGNRCQRLIRDCTEPFQNGYKDDSLTGIYWIQPLSAPAPFQIRCALRDGGVSLPLKITNLFQTGLTWEQMKSGFGENLTGNPNPSNFFIGLDNLHHLVSQGSYTNHIFLMYNNYNGQGSSYYNNFCLGPESTSYAISYGSYDTISERPADNLFTSSPVVFCTLDRCSTACAQQRNGAGWFDPSCSGLTLFMQNTVWSFNGAQQRLDLTEFNLLRYSNFLD